MHIGKQFVVGKATIPIDIEILKHLRLSGGFHADQGESDQHAFLGCQTVLAILYGTCGTASGCLYLAQGNAAVAVGVEELVNRFGAGYGRRAIAGEPKLSDSVIECLVGVGCVA